MTDSISEQHSDLVQKILSGVRWVMLFRICAQVFTWISTLIVIRFLAPEDYGLNSMIESPLIIVMLFSTFGLDLALVQRKRLTQEELRSSFGLLLIINTFLSGVIALPRTASTEAVPLPCISTLV